MNLDLIKKLTRLANNNPNENEANLAARRVCKMLEEGKWQLPTAKFTPEYVKPEVKPTTWNDVKRSEEPMWSSKSQTPPSDAFYDFLKKNPMFWDLFNREDKEFKGGQRGGKSSRNYDIPRPDFKDIFTEKPPSSTNWDKESAPIKVCERCKKEYKSPRVINVCAECQWKERF